MNKQIFLKNVATMVACFAVCFMMSCKEGGVIDDLASGGSAKFSPPTWIQGSWGMEGYEIFKFTTNDIFVWGTSLKATFQSVAGVTYSCKETSTSTLYEVKVTQKYLGSETAAGTFSFKKGDGTYIDAATADEGDIIQPSDYERLNKMN